MEFPYSYREAIECNSLKEQEFLFILPSFLTLKGVEFHIFSFPHTAFLSCSLKRPLSCWPRHGSISPRPHPIALFGQSTWPDPFPSSDINYPRSGTPCFSPEDGSSTVLRNVSIEPKDYAAEQLRRSSPALERTNNRGISQGR